MKVIALSLVLMMSIALGGCGGILSGDFFPNEQHVGGTAAHLVYRAPVDCRAGVARTHNSDFLLYRVASDGVPPREGQVLEGPTRPGRSVFQVFHADQNRNWRAGWSVPLEVMSTGLTLENAREELEKVCRET